MLNLAFFDAEEKAGRGKDGDDGLGDALFEALAGLGVDALRRSSQAVDRSGIGGPAKGFGGKSAEHLSGIFLAIVVCDAGGLLSRKIACSLWGGPEFLFERAFDFQRLNLDIDGCLFSFDGRKRLKFECELVLAGFPVFGNDKLDGVRRFPSRIRRARPLCRRL